MNVFIIVILTIITIGLITIVIYKNKGNKRNKEIQKRNDLTNSNIENSLPSIQIIENSTVIPSEKNKIVDMNIKNAISTIDNYGPKMYTAKDNIETASNLLNKKRVFFSADKKGTKNMLKVKNSNEYYGIQMKKSKLNNRKLFNKQTKFKNENELIKSYGKKELANAGINVASMVVGQYYMNEINDKLETIKDDLKKVNDFLESKYQSDLERIIFKLQEIIINEGQILSNDYLRDKKYNEVQDLEASCTTLLGQANIEIRKNISENIDYKKYENKIKEINIWFIRQQILQQLLLKIGDLKYALACGNESSDSCHTQYNLYLKQTNDLNEQLKKWHIENCKNFKIHKEEARKDGIFFDIRINTIGRINEDWAYDKINSDIVEMLDKQMNIEKLPPYANKKENEIIKIQKYKGEYYNFF